MLRGSLLRGSLGAVLVGASMVIAFAPGTPAGAAPKSSCAITGNVSPTVVDRGQNVTITAAVGPDGGFCNANSFEILGGPFTLWTENLTSGSGGHTIVVGAFDGLSSITVALDTGQRSQIGTVTVLSPTPIRGTRTVIRRTVTVPAVPASRSAALSAAAAASRSAAARASRAATPIRTSTVTSTAFPSDSAAPSSGAGTAGDTPATDAASATGFSVNVRTDPSGGSSVPVGPLLLALLVLAGFVAAAARLIYTHAREEIEA